MHGMCCVCRCLRYMTKNVLYLVHMNLPGRRCAHELYYWLLLPVLMAAPKQQHAASGRAGSMEKETSVCGGRRDRSIDATRCGVGQVLRRAQDCVDRLAPLYAKKKKAPASPARLLHLALFAGQYQTSALITDSSPREQRYCLFVKLLRTLRKSYMHHLILWKFSSYIAS